MLTFVAQSCCASLASFSVIGEVHSQPIGPREKINFLLIALKQLEDERQAETKAAEKRGEFASVSPPTNVVPFGDWDWFYIKDGEARWFPNQGQAYKFVEVPIGFVSDLASVPSILWSKYPPQGRYAIAAIIHDYLYWIQTRPRAARRRPRRCFEQRWSF